MIDTHSRRTFLHAALAAGGAWAAADLLQVEAALAFAAQQQAAGGPRTTTALSSAEADTIEAATGRILPAIDGRAGAREAGAVLFIDQALVTFNAGQRQLYQRGIADLDRRATQTSRATPRFAALEPARQDELLRAIEQTPFFQALRFDTIVGTFALPAWGGNRDYAGWHLIGLDHQPRFQAPFGYYDAEINGRR
jgi:gluconate 2-dehydrogenase gamma chain